MLGCVSCKGEAPNNDPVYNIFQSADPTDISPTATDNPSIASDISPTLTENPAFVTDNSSIPADSSTADNNQQTTTNTDQNQIEPAESSSSLKEEPWPYHLEFDGISPTGTNKAGNLSLNYKMDYESLSNFICPDEDNELLYYVNYGLDNYIYKLKGGICSLVLEKEAYFLNLWDNKLYFLCKNENQYGDIYCYDLDTNKLQLIKNSNAHILIVDSLGIYYEDIVDLSTGEVAFYRLDFNHEISKTLYHPYLQSYYQYQLIADGEKNGVYLVDSKTQEEHFIAPIHYYDYGIKIYDNNFIFNKDGVFYLLNLLTGDKTTIRWMKKEKNEVIPAVDYILMDNIIYLHNHITIDLASGLVTPYYVRYIDYKDAFNTRCLYTDGNKVYAIVDFKLAGNRFELVELEYDDTECLVKFKSLDRTRSEESLKEQGE